MGARRAGVVEEPEVVRNCTSNALARTGSAYINQKKATLVTYQCYLLCNQSYPTRF